VTSFFPTAPAVRRLATLALTAALLAPAAARADAIVTAQIQAQYLDDPGTYPTTVNIGTFSFTDPAFSTLVGATVSGAFGSASNPFLTSTAPGAYSVGGVTVFTCNVGDLCWSNSNGELLWSYTFTASDLASLVQGSNVDQAINLAFNLAQSDVGNADTDVTTLTLDFSVPEPASITLMGAALLGLVAIRRSLRA
jgi:hypothetical protein